MVVLCACAEACFAAMLHKKQEAQNTRALYNSSLFATQQLKLTQPAVYLRGFAADNSSSEWNSNLRLSSPILLRCAQPIQAKSRLVFSIHDSCMQPITKQAADSHRGDNDSKGDESSMPPGNLGAQ